jgi:hypothetical protein
MGEVIKGASKEGAPVRVGVISRVYFNSLYPLQMQHSLLNIQGNRMLLKDNTGRFIMLSLITNIHNKKTKGPTLMELFTVIGKLKIFFGN